ncbi:MAG: vitamin-B12 independent methionine synthase [Dehalococcoidia bacterium]|nr:vitamin-B12 independent methionine synthase [Dehalococcoidia bacterium]
MSALPLFPVTTVGSWPRPAALLRAQGLRRRGRLDDEAWARVADAAVLDALRAQEDAGVDIVTDGEQRRDNFYSFVAAKLSGVRLLTLADLLGVIEDKASFEAVLRTLDVPAYAISTPACVGRVALRAPLAVDELRFLQAHTARPIKVTLPGPYLLMRAMFVPELARGAYDTKEQLGDDVVAILRAELAALASAGAAFVQFDEPVLTELVFTQGRTRTFMCAALAARQDPAEELEFAVELLTRVLDGAPAMRTGVHICRGNWSRDESTLLRGSYAPLAPYLERLPVQQLVLEQATERAGELRHFAGKEIGLGVVNPRSDAVETAEAIVEAGAVAAALYGPERVFLNSDCGFGTFSARPINNATVAARKLRAMSAAAAALRARYPGPAA